MYKAKASLKIPSHHPLYMHLIINSYNVKTLCYADDKKHTILMHTESTTVEYTWKTYLVKNKYQSKFKKKYETKHNLKMGIFKPQYDLYKKLEWLTKII